MCIENHVCVTGEEVSFVGDGGGQSLAVYTQTGFQNVQILHYRLSLHIMCTVSIHIPFIVSVCIPNISLMCFSFSVCVKSFFLLVCTRALASSSVLVTLPVCHQITTSLTVGSDFM